MPEYKLTPPKNIYSEEWLKLSDWDQMRYDAAWNVEGFNTHKKFLNIPYTKMPSIKVTDERVFKVEVKHII